MLNWRATLTALLLVGWTSPAHSQASAPQQADAHLQPVAVAADAESVQVADAATFIQPPDRTTALEARLESFLQKQATTTYPNVKVSGAFQADAGFFSQDAASTATFGTIQNGADFRRARLAANGSVTENVNYFFQMDFGAFGRPTFTDVWVEQTDMPVLGSVRIGQWKHPFSLEVVSSYRYTTFMERSLLFQPFTPFRHIGVGFADRNEALTRTWAASIFRSGQDQSGGSLATQGGVGTAGRITWLPQYDDAANGRYYLHLGLGSFFNAPPNDTINFRSIPEFFVGENAPGAVGTSAQAVPGALDGTPFFVFTGPLAVDWYNVLGAELLWVRGPLSVQSEVMYNYVDRAAATHLDLPGGYVQVGCFLTGEHRPYDRKAGAIDRVIPFTNFFRVRTDNGVAGGIGAWEVALRGSTLQLKSNGVNGGSLTDVTAGVNWYWNPYTKVVFNYIAAMLQNPVNGHSTTHIFGMRAQTDF